MDFINDWRVMVKESLCDVCSSDLRQKIVEDTFPKQYRNSKGHIKQEHGEDWRRHWRKKREVFNKALEDAREICFVFEADCGGDSIALCKKHLQEIIKRIDKIKNDNNMPKVF